MKFNHNKMRKERRKRDMSQIELAKKCGITQASISYIESGKKVPSENNAKLIASALGLPVESIYKG